MEELGLVVSYNVVELARVMDNRARERTRAKRKRSAKGHKKVRKRHINKSRWMDSLRKWAYNSRCDIDSENSDSSDSDSEQEEMDAANAAVEPKDSSSRINLEEVLAEFEEVGRDVNVLRARFPLPHERGPVM